MDVIAVTAHELNKAAEVFTGARPRLMQIAHRTLGSASDAEDIVQDAWLKWQRTDRTVVRNPVAFLATTTTRIAINTVMSARHRHESYTDPQNLEWVAPTTEQPDDPVEQQESVERAILLLLQTLTPKERAAYLLREAFGYPHQQIAEVLDVSTAYARQLIVRAHRGISRPRRLVNRDAHSNLVTAFRDAARTGNLRRLEQLLAADALRCAAFSEERGIENDAFL